MLRLIREELAGVAADGLTAEEVARGRGQLKGGLVLGLGGHRVPDEPAGQERALLRRVPARAGGAGPAGRRRREAGARGGGRAVQPADVPGGRRSVPRVGPRPALTGPAAALRCTARSSRGVFAVAVLVSLAVLFAPAADVPIAPAGVDKVVHCSLFAALALTGRWAGHRRARRSASLLVAYAAVSEVVQGLTAAGPDGSPWPTGWPTWSGVLLGLALWELASRRRRAPS